MKSKGVILYLRTDIWDQEMTAGGSVAHTLGVIKGFRSLGYSIVCASSCLDSVLKKVDLTSLIKLENPKYVHWLRWRINCLLSSFFFFFQTRSLVVKYPIPCIYQRYTLLNMTGLLLAWWYKKKFVLEYNGSEVWTAVQWVKKKPMLSVNWLMNSIELINVRRADYVIVVSEVLKQELLERGVKSDKILVNPNGVDPESFNTGKIKKVEL